MKAIDILLADDDPDDCLFFKEALDGLSISMELTAVHNGEQLMLFLNDKTNKLPHILFLDLNMPRKNGFECLKEIKQNKKLNTIPVIIFSTSFEKDMVNKLYENGANYFIRKPADFLQFKKIIQYILALLAAENIAHPTKDIFVLNIADNLII